MGWVTLWSVPGCSEKLLQKLLLRPTRQGKEAPPAPFQRGGQTPCYHECPGTWAGEGAAAIQCHLKRLYFMVGKLENGIVEKCSVE